MTRELNYDEAVERQQFHKNYKADFNFLVFMGRFSPLHNSHVKVISHALERTDYVIVLIGSAHSPSNYRNPWSWEVREHLIRAVFSDIDGRDVNDRILIAPIEDALYNDTLWIEQVQETVNGLVKTHHHFQTDPHIGLIGCQKDGTSYYLKKFPQWDSVGIPAFDCLSATHIRNGLFSNIAPDYVKGVGDIVPVSVQKFLYEYIKEQAYQELCKEFEFIQQYRTLWANTPYPAAFVTTDAIVVQSGHVLLIERGEYPQKGLLAFPGGFKRADQTLEDSMIRELREETRIKVPDPVLRGSIVTNKVFDDPHRDPRGQFITDAYLLKLRDMDLPEVRGSDDAKKAMWVPLSEVKRSKMGFDHFDILKVMLGYL